MDAVKTKAAAIFMVIDIQLFRGKICDNEVFQCFVAAREGLPNTTTTIAHKASTVDLIGRRSRVVDADGGES